MNRKHWIWQIRSLIDSTVHSGAVTLSRAEKCSPATSLPQGPGMVVTNLTKDAVANICISDNQCQDGSDKNPSRSYGLRNKDKKSKKEKSPELPKEKDEKKSKKKKAALVKKVKGLISR